MPDTKGMTFDECISHLSPCSTVSTRKRAEWRLVELADNRCWREPDIPGFVRGAAFALMFTPDDEAMQMLRRVYDLHQLGWHAKPGAHGGVP